MRAGEPQLRVVRVPNLFADAMAKAQARLDAERAQLSPELRSMLEEMDAKIEAEGFSRFVLGGSHI